MMPDAPTRRMETHEARVRYAPTCRDLVLVALVASSLRVAFFILISLRYDASISQWAARGDGESYIHYAQAMLGDASALTEYDRRVFPGYPGLIALAHLLHVPFPQAALGIDWLCAGLVAALAARLFRDIRIGWACVVLIPQYLINSTMAMSEAPLLALTLAGLVLASRGAGAVGGALLGVAGLVRPMACFAVIGRMTVDLLRRRAARALVAPLVAGAVVLAGILVLHWFTGDAFKGVRVYAYGHNTYAGNLFAWPFQSLVTESMSGRVGAWRLVYVWVQVAITLAGCFALVVQWIRNRGAIDERDALALPWLLGNTLFVLCVGSYWGFQHFPRFTIPAMPALFWSLRWILPRQWYAWAALIVGVPLLLLPTVMREFVVPR